MNGEDDRIQERAGRLLMGALDGELTPEEQAELDALVAVDEELREELRRLARVKEVTESMKLRKPPEETWDAYWNSVYSRMERGLGWILLSLGAIVVGSWAGWHGVRGLLADADLPFLIKGGILAGIVGLVILLVSVVRHRIFVSRTDPYKDIDK